ncbi:MAG: SufE family protein [Alphaproteobacteria bacterium]|nr:SufE family protein [Alphaproteobacteria bacterium]
MVGKMTFDEIKKLLGMLNDPVARLEAVVEIGKSLKTVPQDAICTEIKGCTSFVQICMRENQFFGTADSAVVRGIVAIILSMVDGKSADEIRSMDLATMFSNLEINIGSSRLNGVNSMIRFLKNL